MGQEELVVPEPLGLELDRLGLEFLVEIFTRELARRPENLEALSGLGHVLTRLGRHEEALAHDRELVRRQPGCEVARYNLACSLALTGARESALTALEEAVELGYRDAADMETDEDLASLRESPRFRALIARLGVLGSES